MKDLSNLTLNIRFYTKYHPGVDFPDLESSIQVNI